MCMYCMYLHTYVSQDFKYECMYVCMHVCMYVGVIFLTGSIIERIKDEDMQIKGYFGFEIMHQDLCTGADLTRPRYS